MALGDAQRAASKRRHQEQTQLEVSKTPRAYRRVWFARLGQEVFEQGRPYAIGSALTPREVFGALDLPVAAVDANQWDDEQARRLVVEFIETRLPPR